MKTCPSKMGCMTWQLQEACVNTQDLQPASPCGIQTPCYLPTPTAESWSQLSWDSRSDTSAMAALYLEDPNLGGSLASHPQPHVPALNLASLLGLEPLYSVGETAAEPVVAATPPQFPESPPEHSAIHASTLEVPVVPPPPPGPAPGSPEMPSLGSSGHAQGSCKPCAFLHSKGCHNGVACSFCHLCEAGEVRRRKKDKIQRQRMTKKQHSSK